MKIKELKKITATLKNILDMFLSRKPPHMSNKEYNKTLQDLKDSLHLTETETSKIRVRNEQQRIKRNRK